MARESSIPMLPSLVDRLIDREPRVTSEAPSTQSQSMRELKESLRRDLEWLLNARRTPVEPPESARELPRSVYSFGLPDYTAYSLKTENDKRRLARIMESTIGIFEPRLTAVSVNVLENTGPLRVLRFHIEALLRMQPAPQRVFFDARLELSTNQYRIEGDARAR